MYEKNEKTEMHICAYCDKNCLMEVSYDKIDGKVIKTYYHRNCKGVK